nr:MAG TPA: hypothetical protein [Caudoviricetes sp.]
MNGITFGNYHSYDDLHLILASKEIGAPTVKTMKNERNHIRQLSFV